MVKHTNLLASADELSVFDQFVGLAFKLSKPLWKQDTIT